MSNNVTHNPSNNGGIILLDTKQLKELLHIKGDATLWRYLKEGKLPQPTINISRTKRLWALDEVSAHLSKITGVKNDRK
jgi:predicted DNA-binding transcriptional regulator AlpA